MTTPFIFSVTTPAVNTTVQYYVSSFNNTTSDEISYDVNWGDSSPTEIITIGVGSISHTYAAAGSYDITITTTGYLYFNNSSLILTNTNDYPTVVKDWGTQPFSRISFEQFALITFNFNVGATTAPVFRPGATLLKAFYTCTNFNEDLSSWDMTNVVSIAQMFEQASKFNNGDPGNNGANPLSWGSTMSGITTIASLFKGALIFNQNVSGWDLTSCTTAANTFDNARLFNNGEVTDTGANTITWSNTNNINTISSIFFGTNVFNQPLAFNTTGVQNFSLAFIGAKKFNQPLINFVTSTATNITQIFNGATVFNQDLSSWDVSNVTNFSLAFRLTNAFNQDLNSWDVSKSTNFSSMFKNAIAFNNGDSGDNGAKPMTWGNKTSLVSSFSAMFNNADAFNQDISSFNVSSALSMRNMFIGCLRFNNGDTGNNGAKPLTSWASQMSSVTNVSGMFSNTNAFNQEITGWNVGAVTSIFNMFLNAVAFNNGDPGDNSLKPLSWSSPSDTVGITSFQSLFQGATSFNQDISSWNTSTVTNMRNILSGATLFNQDLSAWNIANVRDFVTAFSNSGIDYLNYDSMLEAWAPIGKTAAISFGATNLRYTAATARQSLISKGWTFVRDYRYLGGADNATHYYASGNAGFDVTAHLNTFISGTEFSSAQGLTGGDLDFTTPGGYSEAAGVITPTVLTSGTIDIVSITFRDPTYDTGFGDPYTYTFVMTYVHETNQVVSYIIDNTFQNVYTITYGHTITQNLTYSFIEPQTLFILNDPAAGDVTAPINNNLAGGGFFVILAEGLDAGSNPETYTTRFNYTFSADVAFPDTTVQYNVSTSFDIGTYIDNYFIGEGSTLRKEDFIYEVSPTLSNVGYVYTLEDFGVNNTGHIDMIYTFTVKDITTSNSVGTFDLTVEYPPGTPIVISVGNVDPTVTTTYLENANLDLSTTVPGGVTYTGYGVGTPYPTNWSPPDVNGRISIPASGLIWDSGSAYAYANGDNDVKYIFQLDYNHRPVLTPGDATVTPCSPSCVFQVDNHMTTWRDGSSPTRVFNIGDLTFTADPATILYSSPNFSLETAPDGSPPKNYTITVLFNGNDVGTFNLEVTYPELTVVYPDITIDSTIDQTEILNSVQPPGVNVYAYQFTGNVPSNWTLVDAGTGEIQFGKLGIRTGTFGPIYITANGIDTNNANAEVIIRYTLTYTYEVVFNTPDDSQIYTDAGGLYNVDTYFNGIFSSTRLYDFNDLIVDVPGYTYNTGTLEIPPGMVGSDLTITITIDSGSYVDSYDLVVTYQNAEADHVVEFSFNSLRRETLDLGELFPGASNFVIAPGFASVHPFKYFTLNPTTGVLTTRLFNDTFIGTLDSSTEKHISFELSSVTYTVSLKLNYNANIFFPSARIPVGATTFDLFGLVGSTLTDQEILLSTGSFTYILPVGYSISRGLLNIAPADVGTEFRKIIVLQYKDLNYVLLLDSSPQNSQDPGGSALTATILTLAAASVVILLILFFILF